MYAHDDVGNILFIYEQQCKNKHEVNGKTGLITDSKHVCGDTNNIT